MDEYPHGLTAPGGPKEGLNGYICLYNGQRWETYAETQYRAQQAAVEHFKVPAKKQHLLDTWLAEKDGEAVTHTPEF